MYIAPIEKSTGLVENRVNCGEYGMVFGVCILLPTGTPTPSNLNKNSDQLQCIFA